MSEAEEKARLIKQMGSRDNAEALEAVKALREKGWFRPLSLQREISLSGANLRGAKLFQTDLTGVDLSGATLSHADLTGANLLGANLSNANLTGAQLYNTNLSATNLSQANLTKANLIAARLIGATLSGMSMWDAMCAGTVFSDVDLSDVNGLETIYHDGVNIIDIQTLYNSKGKIPEIFLLKAGVPKEFIEFTQGMFGKVIEFYSCFISYSHADKDFARRLYDTLIGHGINCWLDEHQMNPGDDIYEEINRGIRLWDKVLLCCSENSLKSWWVDNELDTAFEKERQLMKERGHKVLAVIPLNLDNYLEKPEYQSGKKQPLSSRVWADFVGWDGAGGTAIFNAGVESVIKALRTDGGKAAPPESRL